MKVKSKRHKNVHYEYFWSKTQKSYTIRFWIGVQGFTLNHRPDTKATRDWYFDRIDDAFEAMIRNQRPMYINENIKKVSKVDLKAALKEVNEKNRKIRESYRLDSEVMDFRASKAKDYIPNRITELESVLRELVDGYRDDVEELRNQYQLHPTGFEWLETIIKAKELLAKSDLKDYIPEPDMNKSLELFQKFLDECPKEEMDKIEIEFLIRCVELEAEVQHWKTVSEELKKAMITGKRLSKSIKWE